MNAKIKIHVVLALAAVWQASCNAESNLWSVKPGNRYDGPSSIIPGTNLKTRTFYKLTLKHFPDGVITWTEKKNEKEGYHYVQVDSNPERSPKYDKNGEWYKDTQWEFVPQKGKEFNSNWYLLRNRALPNEYATWSRNEAVAENQQTFYLILEPRYKEKVRQDFLFKPVPTKLGSGGKQNYYQLKIKGAQDGVVTWSEKMYGKNSHYIQLDNRDDEEHMKKYEKGNDWYDDTLFAFEEVEKDEIEESNME